MEEMFSIHFRGIPDYIFILSFLFLSIGIALSFIIIREFAKAKRNVFFLLLIVYIFLMLCSTLIYRVPRPNEIRLELTPFWNYGEILSFKDPNDLLEVLLNILLYIPIGFLLGCIFKDKCLVKVLTIGLCLSISVETLQFVLHRGLAETDDVIHNSLGCLLGYLFIRCLIQNRNISSNA